MAFMVAPIPEPEPINPFAAPEHGPAPTASLPATCVRVVAVIAAASALAFAGYCTLLEWDGGLAVPMAAAGVTMGAVVALLNGPLRREARVLLTHGDLWVPLLLLVGFSGWISIAIDALMGEYRWHEKQSLITLASVAVLVFTSGWTVRMAVQVVDEERCDLLEAAGYALRWAPRVGFAMLVMWVATLLGTMPVWHLGTLIGAGGCHFLAVAIVVAVNALSMALLPLVAVGREPLWSEARRAFIIAWHEMPRWWWLILAQVAIVGVICWTGWAPARFGARLPVHPAWIGGLYGSSGWVSEVMPVPAYGPRAMLAMGVAHLAIGGLAVAAMLRVVAGIRRHDPRRGLEAMRHAQEVQPGAAQLGKAASGTAA